MDVVKQKELLGQELGDQIEQDQKDEANNKKIAEAEVKQKAAEAKKKNVLVLRNTLGEEVDQKDYFFSAKGKETAPPFFEEMCGRPVDREDMLAVFSKVFKTKNHGLLFYRCKDKEVYIIIVPLKHSSVVGAEHNSVEGEFQKHAISFISEGSVNLDTLRTKLERVAKTIHIVED